MWVMYCVYMYMSFSCCTIGEWFGARSGETQNGFDPFLSFSDCVLVKSRFIGKAGILLMCMQTSTIGCRPLHWALERSIRRSMPLTLVVGSNKIQYIFFCLAMFLFTEWSRGGPFGFQTTCGTTKDQFMRCAYIHLYALSIFNKDWNGSPKKDGQLQTPQPSDPAF